LFISVNFLFSVPYTVDSAAWAPVLSARFAVTYHIKYDHILKCKKKQDRCIIYPNTREDLLPVSRDGRTPYGPRSQQDNSTDASHYDGADHERTRSRLNCCVHVIVDSQPPIRTAPSAPADCRVQPARTSLPTILSQPIRLRVLSLTRLLFHEFLCPSAFYIVEHLEDQRFPANDLQTVLMNLLFSVSLPHYANVAVSTFGRICISCCVFVCNVLTFDSHMRPHDFFWQGWTN